MCVISHEKNVRASCKKAGISIEGQTLKSFIRAAEL